MKIWSRRFSFYLAVMGTAFGLGNLWRFPYVVSENGGGAFVLIYVLLAFFIGMPLLISEFMLGKVSRKSILTSMKSLEMNVKTKMQSEPTLRMKLLAKIYPYTGYICLAICLLVLSYFSVISGWVLYFFSKFSVVFATQSLFVPQESLELLMNSHWLQISLTSVHILLVVIVVAKDFDDGVEKFSGYIMPIFGLLLVGLMMKSLSLDTTEQAMRYLFYPDFSKLTLASLGHALGHVLFTLSIGFGLMVTFGSYLRDKSYLPITGFRVATVDSMMSLFAGMLIFPLIAFTPGYSHGPLLLFETVPVFLNSVSGGQLFGMGFFLCLYLGALGASVALLETVVANLIEADKMKRSQAAWWAGVICFSFSLFPALSASILISLDFSNRSALEILDSLVVNWVLPIIALVVSQVVLYFVASNTQKQEFRDEASPSSMVLYRHWIFALRWLIPSVTILALTLQIIAL